MPFKSASLRRKATADGMRRRRIYLAAVARGDPKALEAERQFDLADDPMRPVYELEERLKPLSKEAREPFRAKHAALKARCQAVDTEAARREYQRLRAEVIEAGTKRDFANLL